MLGAGRLAMRLNHGASMTPSTGAHAMTDNASGTILPKLTATLAERLPGLIAVYRFSSFGTADARADSDIDLGLQADAPLDPVALFRLAADLATMAARNVDLVDMIACSTVMRARIVATGEVIHCRDACLCDAFTATAYSRYAYLNEERRGILADIQASGSIHGQ